MSRRKRRKSRSGLDRRLLILLSVTPFGCLLAILVGLLITWFLFPTRYINASISDLPQEEADEIVIMAAADFAEYEDVERAQELLADLNVPNKAQYVSLVAERMIRTNRGPVDGDIENVVRLADALGVSTVSMVLYVSTATATPTETPIPTDTPPPTPTPTNTLVVEAVAVAEVAADEAPEAEPTEEPGPTDTPTPVPATNTPAPPTDTPEPTATPTPEVDFIIAKQRLLTKDENGGCVGMHSIFVTVVDAAGNPIKGVQMADEWGAVNPGPVTGHKGDDQPGLAMYDLYKNGYKIFVKDDPTAGRPVTSQISEILSSNDWEIGIPRLIEAGYCPDEATCKVLWNSGVFGEGNNSLCWGHYSWEITFQRTW